MIGAIAMTMGLALPAAAQVSDPETARVQLVEKIERSVAVVRVASAEVIHARSTVTLEEGEALGSGVLLSADGVVLTAAHVVKGAREITVQFRQGEPLQASVVFVDDSADLALLKVSSVPQGVEPAKLGNSDLVRKGQTVYLVGSPVGAEFSLSMGVVSGRHTPGHLFGGTVEAEIIQTDAAMNAGSSGGPMFNSRGEVIAIAQRILSRSGGSEGLGFGLAINAVKKVFEIDPCLWLGFSAVPLDDLWTGALNVPQGDGLLIQVVTPGSPAAKAGLRGGSIPVQVGSDHLLLGGDVIIKVDGIRISEWSRQAWKVPPKEGEIHKLVVAVIRAGREIEIPIETVHRSHW